MLRVISVFSVFIFFLTQLAHAQSPFPLQIQVNVLPPYSAFLQDYPGAGQRVRVLLINTSTQTYQVRLTGQLTGDNGVEVRTSPNYRPQRPVTVPPGQTLLSRTDLEGLFDLNQIEVTGLDKNVLARGLPLPDGMYQLCVRAYNETASRTSGATFGQPLSPEFPLGCSAPIIVRAVEPPILISPLCDAEVTATVPQAVVFTWTPPAGVSPTQVDYTLRIVELPQVAVDPNVYIDAVALPRSGVEVRNLRTSTFLYGPTQPPLQLGKRYAWRVQAIDRSGRLNFLNDGKAPVCAFTYGNGPVFELAKKPGFELAQTPIVPIPGLTSLPATPSVDSSGAEMPVVMKSNKICKSVALPNGNSPQSGPLNGKAVTLGEFELTIAQATFQNGSYTGEGRVTWNGAPIKVAFTGLKVNGQNQVFDGEVNSSGKGPGMPNIPLGQIDGYGGLPNNYFDQIKTTLLDAAKQAVAIPLPLKYDGKLGTVGINRMSFSPVGAEMDLVVGVSLPEANLNLFLAAVDVCTSPQKKLPNTGTLYLVKDLPMPIPGGIGQKFVFKKSDPSSAKPDGTYATIINNDFDKVHGVLTLNLGSSILKADDGKGTIKAGDLVGTVTADFVQWADWVGTVSLPPFQVPGLSGVTFTGNDVVYDHSDKANPAGFSLPNDYTGDKGPTFHGTYFNKLTVELPSSFKSNPRIGIAVNSGIIDGSGFTGLIAAANKPILDYTKGSLAGFGFGIDDIQWTIVQNSNRGGNMLGQLQFPISTGTFSYSCSLSGGFTDMQFTTAPKDGYQVPLFAANMDLNANTSILVTCKAGQSTKVNMILGGVVSIDVKKFAGSGAVGKTLDATIPKLYFEQFTVSNVASQSTTAIGGSGLHLYTGIWNLTNDIAQAGKPGGTPKNGGSGPSAGDEAPDEWAMTLEEDSKPSLGGFPLDFAPPTMVTTAEGAGLRLGIGLHLGDAADDKQFVQAKGTLDILGTITTENGRFKPVYNGIYPRSVSVDGSIGPLTVKAGLDFINQNLTYGNGIKGNATVKIPGFDVKIKMVMLFGNVSGYKYGFIDGSVQFPVGVPIVGPIVLTGLGGGMHYNMGMVVNGKDALKDPDSVTKLPKATADNNSPLPVVDLTQPGKTMSGAVFSPAKGNWGLTAKIYAGLADPKVFNASLAMTVSFDGGSMGGINLHGNANVISTSGDGDGKDGMVHAVMDITYAQGVLDASLGVDAKFLTATAHIPFSMHVASGSDWFVKIGDPNVESERIKVTLLDINQSPLRAYLAAQGYVATGVGPNLGGLPPVPFEVADFLSNQKGNTLSSARDAYKKRPLPNLMPIGNDYKLLLGGRLDGQLKVQVQPFRLWATAIAGFDVALAKNVKCGGSNDIPAGLFGWYGQGQAYTYLAGGIDLYVDVWFFEGSLELMKLQAGAVLTAGFPDPTWADGKVKIKGEVLDGLISVETTQDFAFGAKCVPVYNGDPLKDLVIISDMAPADGDIDISPLPTMAVAFNMPMNKVFQIYISSDDIRYYVFRPDAPVFQMKPKGGTGYQNITKLNPLKWASDKRSYNLSASAFLPSFATCRLTQRVVVKELANAYSVYGQDPMNDKTGKREPRSQTKMTTFTLGKQPDEIPLDVITGTWPINGQQYFLKGHLPTGILVGNPLEGLECLKLEAGMQLMANYKGANAPPVSVPVTYDGENTLTFAIPGSLKNQQPYTLEISRQPKSGGTSGQLATSQYVTMAQSPQLQLYRTTLNTSAVQALAALNQANQGKKLFSLSFATSKYNTFGEKLNALNLKATDYKSDQEIYIKPAVDTYERFDRVDLFNTTIYPNFYADRLLNYQTPIAGTPHANTPYEKEVRTMIYDKMRLLAEDGLGAYASAGNGQGVSDDFKPSTLAQDPVVGADYERDAYHDSNGITTVHGAPNRVFFVSTSKLNYNPVSSTLSWRFVRDKMAYWDLVALSGIMKALKKLNYHDVLGAKKYSSDKNLSDQDYLTRYYHDPKAESCGIYETTFYKASYIDGNGQQQPSGSWSNPNYKKMDGVAYDGYGAIISSSPYMTLRIADFTGSFYRQKQYWKFAEDNYYTMQGYTDNQGVDHGGGPERGKSSPFTVVFKYGTGNTIKSVTKVFTIGSINDQPIYQIYLPLVFYPFAIN